MRPYKHAKQYTMKLSRRKFIKGGILVALGALIADLFWFEKFFIETKEFYWAKATKETQNIKVVQLSDLHLQAVNYSLRKLAARLNELQPELVLLTGDAIDKAENLPLLDQFLGLIDQKIKKVAILGNWEYWGHIDLTQLQRVYQNHNGTLLVNQTLRHVVGHKSISITGVDDFIGGRADIKMALKDYQPSDYHIVLNHCPQYSEQISAQLAPNLNVDFILAGHTHGGQFNFFGFIPFLPQGSGKYVKGWYNENVPKLYVSKGIGTSIFPARFGARAEMAIFNLKKD